MLFEAEIIDSVFYVSHLDYIYINIHMITHVNTHTHTRQNWIFEEIHQELSHVNVQIRWQTN